MHGYVFMYYIFNTILVCNKIGLFVTLMSSIFVLLVCPKYAVHSYLYSLYAFKLVS